MNHYVRSETQDAKEPGEDSDPKVAFKSRSAVGHLEHQVISLTERLAMEVKHYWFDVEPQA